MRYFLITGAVFGVLFLPLLSEVFLQNFGSSLDLYFRKFEFNASLYYLLRWIGYQLSGYNIIAHLGPALGLLVLGGITFFSWKEKAPQWFNLPSAMLFAICLFLFCTTTVHPWYTILPVVLCVFTPFRFPVLWSGLIILTYRNYSYDSYHENLWLVALEYLLVAVMLLLEWKKLKPKATSAHII